MHTIQYNTIQYTICIQLCMHTIHYNTIQYTICIQLCMHTIQHNINTQYAYYCVCIQYNTMQSIYTICIQLCMHTIQYNTQYAYNCVCMESLLSGVSALTTNLAELSSEKMDSNISLLIIILCFAEYFNIVFQTFQFLNI